MHIDRNDAGGRKGCSEVKGGQRTKEPNLEGHLSEIENVNKGARKRRD